MINWFKSIYNLIKLEIDYRKKLKKTRDNDPYLYK